MRGAGVVKAVELHRESLTALDVSVVDFQGGTLNKKRKSKAGGRRATLTRLLREALLWNDEGVAGDLLGVGGSGAAGPSTGGIEADVAVAAAATAAVPEKAGGDSGRRINTSLTALGLNSTRTDEVGNECAVTPCCCWCADNFLSPARPSPLFYPQKSDFDFALAIGCVNLAALDLARSSITRRDLLALVRAHAPALTALDISYLNFCNSAVGEAGACVCVCVCVCVWPCWRCCHDCLPRARIPAIPSSHPPPHTCSRPWSRD